MVYKYQNCTKMIVITFAILLIVLLRASRQKYFCLNRWSNFLLIIVHEYVKFCTDIFISITGAMDHVLVMKTHYFHILL
jgi:hypothetical protein